MPRPTLPLAVLALLPLPALAQDLTHKAPPQQHPVYIAGATVHTVAGDVINNGLVSFADGKIGVVTTADALDRIRLADNVQVIDATGLHLYPGLFAADTRLGLVEIAAVRASDDYNEVGDFNPEARAAVSINPDSTLFPVARAGGVLLVGAYPAGGRIPGRAAVLRLDGWTWEDMTITDNAGLVIPWPSTTPSNARWSGSPDDDDQRRATEALQALDALFDDAANYHDAARQNAGLPIDLRLEAMRPYLPTDATGPAARPLLIGANGLADITSAVTWCAARNLRCVILGGADAPLCAELLNAHNVPVIIEGTHTFPTRDDHPHDHAYSLPARLHAAGITFAISTADREGNARNLPHEAGMAARYGLPPEEAVKAITLAPAQIYGIDAAYGSIESGKSATLILADGDILEITTNITHAFIDGKAIDLTTKQTELRDKYLDKYRQLNLIND